MELFFLGTSAGVPTRRRNVSALALRPTGQSRWFLFDCGEATQHRIMESSLSLFRLERIFITHLHGDHVYGLFGLLASRGMHRCESPLWIYGPEGLGEMLHTVMRISRLSLPFDLHVVPLLGNETIELEGLRVSTLPLSHSIPSYGFVVEEARRPGRFDPERARGLGIPEGPFFGRLQQGHSVRLPDGRTVHPRQVMGLPSPGKRIAVAGDNAQPGRFEPWGPLDALVHEATYLQEDFDRLEVKYRHTTARALGIAAERIGVGHLLATHISPRYDSPEREQELVEEIRIHFHGTVTLAYDGLRIEI